MKINLESFAKIDESAKVQGVALIPRISRNHNLYTKEELKRFNGVTVPLNWEHNPDKVIGEVTFHYNEENETVYYEGMITDPSASILAKNKVLYTSIEATPTSVKKICNGTTDCFSMPYGLIPEGLALTETPGVPETSVIIEKYIAECNNHEFHKYGATDLIHKTITKEESVDNIMQDRFSDMAKNLEAQISYKDEALQLFKKMSENNPDTMLLDQIKMLENDIGFLTNQLIKLRKDSDFISVESLGDVVSNMKERYLCSCCGDLKKKANIEAKEEPKNSTSWITVNGVHIPIKKGQDKNDVVDDFISKHDDKDKSKAEPKKTDNKTLTPDESNEIVNGLKKHFPITKDPQDKVFLTPDGEWIQLNEGDEHFIILGSITDKYISTDKARNLPSAQYFSHGLIRAGFTKDVTLINGTIPLNSKQQYALELAMIKKGHTTDNLVIEFPDDSIEKQLKHKLSKSLGESVDLKDTEWITVNGVHIPIKKGQNKNDVVQAFLDKHDDEPKKSEPNRQATKKDLTGFNGNVKLSMGKNIDMQSLDKIRNIWNSIDKSEQDLISNIKIRGSTASGRITAGEFIAETNTIEMTVHPTLTDQDYRETFNHEIGHARFKQLSPEKISAWNEAVKDIRPPTKYAKHHRDRATNYRLANLSFRPSDKEIIDQNIKMLTNLYYEEIHSEIHAHIKTGGLNENKIFSKEGLDKAVQLYKEIIQ